MKYSVLGPTGVRVSKVCVGTATFGVAPNSQDAGRIVDAALDLGINFFDTADVYWFDPDFRPTRMHRRLRSANQRRRFSDALSPVGGTKSCSPRNQVSAASTRTPGLSRRYIIQQVEQSLRRLRTDRIDLYYAHFPDPNTPLEQTLTVYDDLIRQGKLRYVALSNHPAWQVTEALWIADDRRLGVRAGLRSSDVQPVGPHCRDRARGTRACASDCRSFRTRRCMAACWRISAVLDRDIAGDKRYGGPGFTEAEIAIARELDRLAREWNLGMQQVSLAWLLSRPAVASVIVGAETTEELAANASAADVELTTEQLEAVSALTRHDSDRN